MGASPGPVGHLRLGGRALRRRAGVRQGVLRLGSRRRVDRVGRTGTGVTLTLVSAVVATVVGRRRVLTVVALAVATEVSTRALLHRTTVGGRLVVGVLAFRARSTRVQRGRAVRRRRRALGRRALRRLARRRRGLPGRGRSLLLAAVRVEQLRPGVEDVRPDDHQRTVIALLTQLQHEGRKVLLVRVLPNVRVTILVRDTATTVVVVDHGHATLLYALDVEDVQNRDHRCDLLLVGFPASNRGVGVLHNPLDVGSRSSRTEVREDAVDRLVADLHVVPQQHPEGGSHVRARADLLRQVDELLLVGVAHQPGVDRVTGVALPHSHAGCVAVLGECRKNVAVLGEFVLVEVGLAGLRVLRGLLETLDERRVDSGVSVTVGVCAGRGLVTTQDGGKHHCQHDQNRKGGSDLDDPRPLLLVLGHFRFTS